MQVACFPIFTSKRADTAFTLALQPVNASATAGAAAAAVATLPTHVEVYIGVEDLGDEVHRRRNHGVLLPHRDLEFVNPCWVGTDTTSGLPLA